VWNTPEQPVPVEYYVELRALDALGSHEVSASYVEASATLVVLPGTLRGVPAILADSCAARGTRSSLTEGRRGGLPQDPDTAVPSLYVAGSPLQPSERSAAPRDVASPLHSALDLRRRCG